MPCAGTALGRAIDDIVVTVMDVLDGIVTDEVLGVEAGEEAVDDGPHAPSTRTTPATTACLLPATPRWLCEWIRANTSTTLTVRPSRVKANAWNGPP